MSTSIIALLGLLRGSMSPIPAIVQAAQLQIRPVTEISDVHDVTVTAYSSTPEETDDTPFTTATGNTVRDGIVATNILDFGTRVQIPELFGDKVFVVDDRMHPRKTKNVDVWMPTKSDALRFGIRHAMVVVLK